MILKIFSISLIGWVLSGCAPSRSAIKVNNEPLAKLISYQVKSGHLYFTTTSHGCTFVDSFKLARANSGENLLKVVQVKPDLCRMKKYPVTLQYSVKHLGLDKNKPVALVNPV